MAPKAMKKTAAKAEKAEKTEKLAKPEKQQKPEKTVRKFPRSESSVPRRYVEEPDTEGDRFHDDNMPAFLRK